MCIVGDVVSAQSPPKSGTQTLLLKQKHNLYSARVEALYSTSILGRVVSGQCTLKSSTDFNFETIAQLLSSGRPLETTRQVRLELRAVSSTHVTYITTHKDLGRGLPPPPPPLIADL